MKGERGRGGVGGAECDDRERPENASQTEEGGTSVIEGEKKKFFEGIRTLGGKKIEQLWRREGTFNSGGGDLLRSLSWGGFLSGKSGAGSGNHSYRARGGGQEFARSGLRIPGVADVLESSGAGPEGS